MESNGVQWSPRKLLLWSRRSVVEEILDSNGLQENYYCGTEGLFGLQWTPRKLLRWSRRYGSRRNIGLHWTPRKLLLWSRKQVVEEINDSYVPKKSGISLLLSCFSDIIGTTYLMNIPGFKRRLCLQTFLLILKLKDQGILSVDEEISVFLCN